MVKMFGEELRNGNPLLLRNLSNLAEMMSTLELEKG
jgi:hypothetical protein